MKIYTKSGDSGQTSLIGGTRIPKSHIRIETYGTVDELNSFTGLLRDHITDETTKESLLLIQEKLFTVGSLLACDPEKDSGLTIPQLSEEDISLLEKEIDRMNEVLPPMKFFILPGGHPVVSHAHVARTVCRRAERNCVWMLEENIPVPPFVIKYLNRLSDYLFVVARYTGHLLNIREIPWKPR